MTAPAHPGRAAVRAHGWLKAHKWLLLRRLTQAGVLALFLAGPVAGLWFVEGNLTSSLTLDALPLTDPFVLSQTLAAGHVAGATALLGAAIVLAAYGLIGGRVYCSFVCPINPLTDAAHWLTARLGIGGGWRPPRHARLWLLAAVFVTAAATGVAAWEMLNPVTLLHRALVFGMGWAWAVAAGIFLFDLLVSERGWCGHLCPHGAFYGLIGRASLLRMSAKNRAACDDCMDCFAVCPEAHVIGPALRGADRGVGPVILSGDCTNCGRCIDVCAQDVFAFDFRFNNGAVAARRPADTTLLPPGQAA